MYFFQSIIHGRAKHGVRGLALQRSPPVPALPDPHTTSQRQLGEAHRKGGKRELRKVKKERKRHKEDTKRFFWDGKKEGLRRSEMTQEKSEALRHF